MRQLTIMTGRSRLEKAWQRKTVDWQWLVERLGQFSITPEHFSDYQKMSKADRGKLKDVGGFVGGTLKGGLRKASEMESRSLITLDLDYANAYTIENIKQEMPEEAWVVYSTHSHCEASPRLRLIVPLDRDCTPDEYLPLARKVAEWIDIDAVDDSSYQPERLMYWPSMSCDATRVYIVHDGEALSVDETLNNEYTDWRDVAEWPVSSRQTAVKVGSGGPQQDPTTKPGIIGAFCRTYTISEAIRTFLPNLYRETNIEGRWTYIPGSTEGGAVVYEDKWMFSHHGTDPCCEKEVNAFDLVRLHKFGSEDVGKDQDTPVNKLPSFKLMEQFALKDTKTAARITDERTTPEEDFSALAAELSGDEQPVPTSVGLWTEEVKALLKWDKKHSLCGTHANYNRILSNHPAIAGKVRYNEFTHRKELIADLPWRKRGDNTEWTNTDDGSLMVWMSNSFNDSTIVKGTVLDTYDAVVARNSYHPVREYLVERRGKWDGIDRLTTLLEKYLGAKPDELSRVMWQKTMVAAVTRIFKPGAKFDYVLTLVGPEGLGKTTIIQKLAGDWFSNSFNSYDIGDNRSMEQLSGHWLIEFGELTDYKKSTSEAFKNFLSKTEDTFRPAYARHSECYKRQCIFFATTNERNFLKGDTGNRRFWPIEVGIMKPLAHPADMTAEERDQIWSEAVYLYDKCDIKLYLNAEEAAQARLLQDDYNEVANDERTGLIENWLMTNLPDNWATLTRAQRQEYFKRAQPSAQNGYQREVICLTEVMEEALWGMYDRYKSKEVAHILRRMGFVPEQKPRRISGYGLQRVYVVPEQFRLKIESIKVDLGCYN